MEAKRAGGALGLCPVRVVQPLAPSSLNLQVLVGSYSSSITRQRRCLVQGLRASVNAMLKTTSVLLGPW